MKQYDKRDMLRERLEMANRRITEQEKRIASLEAALEPFAEAAKVFPTWRWESLNVQLYIKSDDGREYRTYLHYNDFLTAAEVLEGGE